jgi:signal transduction histidine kinase
LAFYLYTVARHCEWRISRWALLAPLVTNLLYAVHVPQIRDWSDAFFGTLVFGLAYFLGLTLRRQAAQRAALADALAQLGREQEQRARLAVLDERARLARDLHDVVAHAVAVMLVQVGAARLALDDDPAAARDGLLNAEQTGREATGDLRRLLGLLRATDESEVLMPAPGVAGLPALREQMMRAGLDVDLEVIGDPPPLSPSLDLSVYRVVQEALTNVLKHAGPTTVRVRLDYCDPSSDGLRIQVVDDGPRGSAGSGSAGSRSAVAEQRIAVPTSGHGLAGMRERVELFGGRIRAGREQGGFAVVVDLPLLRSSATA